MIFNRSGARRNLPARTHLLVRDESCVHSNTSRICAVGAMHEARQLSMKRSRFQSRSRSDADDVAAVRCSVPAETCRPVLATPRAFDATDHIARTRVRTQPVTCIAIAISVRNVTLPVQSPIPVVSGPGFLFGSPRSGRTNHFGVNVFDSVAVLIGSGNDAAHSPCGRPRQRRFHVRVRRRNAVDPPFNDPDSSIDVQPSVGRTPFRLRRSAASGALPEPEPGEYR